jgi:hypothetical protein
VNNTFQLLLRCFCCYDGSDWTTLLPQVEFAYNASRALGIEHTPFEASFGFSPEEPPDLLFSMRPSIPVSQDATKRLRLLQEIHTLVRSVLQLHKDEMQARTKPSTAPHHFARGDKVSVVTSNLFSTRTTEPETQRHAAWTFHNGGVNWETQLHIETSCDSTLTSCVPCEQSTTLLYHPTTTSCPGDCS